MIPQSKLTRDNKLIWVLFIGAGLNLANITAAAAQDDDTIAIENSEGKLIKVGPYANVVGSPYLIDTWTKSLVEFKDGAHSSTEMVRFDLVSGALIFKNAKDQEMSFVNQVKSFTIPYVENNVAFKGAFQNGYKPGKDNTADTFFEVLSDGKVKLLRQVSKKILETKAFYSASVEKSFENSAKYFVVDTDGVPVKIKTDKKSILRLLKDDESKISKYITENNLNTTKDLDLIVIFNHYNSSSQKAG